MVMHPIKPALNGRDLSEFKDPEGKRLFVAMANTVRRQKAGFVPYLWPRPGSEKPVPKVSYVKGFVPWGWVKGSGIYLDDGKRVYAQSILKEAGLISAVLRRE